MLARVEEVQMESFVETTSLAQLVLPCGEIRCGQATERKDPSGAYRTIGANREQRDAG